MRPPLDHLGLGEEIPSPVWGCTDVPPLQSPGPWGQPRGPHGHTGSLSHSGPSELTGGHSEEGGSRVASGGWDT